MPHITQEAFDAMTDEEQAEHRRQSWIEIANALGKLEEKLEEMLADAKACKDSE
jgi:hypothetical protein